MQKLAANDFTLSHWIWRATGVRGETLQSGAAGRGTVTEGWLGKKLEAMLARMLAKTLDRMLAKMFSYFSVM